MLTRNVAYRSNVGESECSVRPASVTNRPTASASNQALVGLVDLFAGCWPTSVMNENWASMDRLLILSSFVGRL